MSKTYRASLTLAARWAETYVAELKAAGLISEGDYTIDEVGNITVRLTYAPTIKFVSI